MNLATAYVQLMAKDGPLRASLTSLNSWVAAQGEKIRKALGGMDADVGDDASKNAEELGDSLENIGEQAKDAVPGLDMMLGRIAAFISLRQLLGVFRFGVKAAAEAETASTAFNVIIKDVERTKRLLEELNQFSVVTPFTPQEVREAGLALVAAKRPLEGIRDDLKMLGDIASGSPRANLNEMVAIFNKINSQGKLTTETLEQFMSQGINLLPELAKYFNRSERSIRGMVEAGQITRPIMQKLFKSMTSEGGTFYQSMQKQSETFAGLMSTLTGVMVDMSKAVGNLLLPVLKGVNKILIAVGNAFLWLDKATMGASTAFLTIAGTALVVNTSLILARTCLLTLATAAWTAATAIWAAISPFLGIIAISAMVAAAIIGLYKLFQPIVDGLIKIGKALFRELLYPFVAVFNAIAGLIGAVGKVIDDVFGGVVRAVGAMLSAIATPIGGVFRAIGFVILWPFYALIGVIHVVSATIRGLWWLIGAFFNVVIGIGKGIYRAFAGAFEPLFEALGPLKEAIQTIFGVFSELFGLIGKVMSSIGRGAGLLVFGPILGLLKIILGLVNIGVGLAVKAVNAMTAMLSYFGKKFQDAVQWMSKLWTGFQSKFRSIFGDTIGDFLFGKAEKGMKAAEDSAKAVGDALRMIKPGFFDMDKLGREVQMKLLEEGVQGGMSDSQQLARIGNLAEGQKAAQERAASLLQEMLDRDKDRGKPEVAAA